MSVPISVLLVAGIAGAIWYARYRACEQRRAALLALATRLGGDFSIPDPFGTVDFPFDLFRKGDGRGIENVISGTRDDAPVRLFDYWYYDESSNGKSGNTKTYHRFTCALSEIPADCPHLAVHPESLLSRLADHVGRSDVELEWDEFNRAFEVRCSDQEFAFALIDGRMMEWLMQSAKAVHVETGGPMVLVATHKLEPVDWPSLLDWQRQFREHVPNAVYAMYKPT